MNLIKTLVFSLLIISVPFLGYADIKSKIEKKLYSKINNFAENLGDGVAESLSDFERLKYLDFSINIQDSLEPTVQIQSVSSIKEYDDGALFNQLNLISHDSETTINLGFGKRKLLDNDALMIGTNLFVDCCTKTETGSYLAFIQGVKQFNIYTNQKYPYTYEEFLERKRLVNV